MAEQQVIRVVIQASDNMTLMRVAFYTSGILRRTALSPAIQSEYREAERCIRQLILPVPGVSGVTMELQNRRLRRSYLPWTGVFSMNARAAYSREIKIKTFRLRRLEFARDQFKIHFNGCKLIQRTFPISIEIGRPGISSFILF
ncbi:hypothetical protein D3C73_1062820 [compost metagenome]